MGRDISVYFPADPSEMDWSRPMTYHDFDNRGQQVGHICNPCDTGDDCYDAQICRMTQDCRVGQVGERPAVNCSVQTEIQAWNLMVDRTTDFVMLGQAPPLDGSEFMGQLRATLTAKIDHSRPFLPLSMFPSSRRPATGAEGSLRYSIAVPWTSISSSTRSFGYLLGRPRRCFSLPYNARRLWGNLALIMKSNVTG
jgi:hypothetical protein